MLQCFDTVGWAEERVILLTENTATMAILQNLLLSIGQTWNNSRK